MPQRQNLLQVLVEICLILTSCRSWASTPPWEFVSTYPHPARMHVSPRKTSSGLAIVAICAFSLRVTSFSSLSSAMSLCRRRSV